MKEIEVKILEVDTKKLQKKLKDFGAKKVFEGEIEGVFFDFEDERLRQADKRLRLRKVGEDVEFTLKRKISRDKARIDEEYQVLVSDFDILQKILLKIGLKKTRQYRKKRTSFTIGNVRFEFDTFENLPTLLEIEAQSVEEVQNWVEKLGFRLEDAKPWSGRDVMRHYGKI
ncbi:class IV adenylate cyclase [Patescibacteria group bacterium]|nr:class IV adenylate cyclase [Patescibacteria group bacterium]